jgi:hypothetical protein
VVFGEFNSVSWSSQFQEFRKNSGLLESRSGFIPASTNGVGSFLEIPVDHILFTPSIQCTGFSQLNSKSELKNLGILSKFMFEN